MNNSLPVSVSVSSGNPRLQQKPFPTTTEGLTFHQHNEQFIPIRINDYEDTTQSPLYTGTTTTTTPTITTSKEMNEQDEHVYMESFNMMIQSLPPEQKKQLFYSLLQHQEQREQFAILLDHQQEHQQEQQYQQEQEQEQQQYQESIMMNNLMKLEGTHSNTMAQPLKSSTSPSLSSSVDSTLNSELVMENVPKAYDKQTSSPQITCLNSNVLMMSNGNNSNSGGGDTIGGGHSNFQSITPIEELWFRSMSVNANQTSPHWIHNRKPSSSSQVSSSSSSSSLPIKSIVGGGHNTHQYNVTNEQDNLMYGISGANNSFPPSSLSSSSADHLFNKQQQSINNHCTNTIRNKTPLRTYENQEEHSFGDQVNLSQPQIVLTGCEKANPEKGSWASGATFGQHNFEICPTRIVSSDLRGKSSSLLSRQLEATSTISNSQPFQNQAILNSGQSVENMGGQTFPYQNRSPQNGMVILDPVTGEKNHIGDPFILRGSHETENGSKQTLFKSPNKSPPQQDANLLRYQTSSAKHNSSSFSNKKETEPTTSNTVLLFNQQHHLSSSPKVIIDNSNKDIINKHHITSQQTEYNSSSSFNVPSINSHSYSSNNLPIGSTTNIQPLYFYRNNTSQLQEQNSGNIEQDVYLNPHHAQSTTDTSLMNNHLPTLCASATSFQSSPPYPSFQQQNYLHQQIQQPCIQGVVNGFSNHHVQTSSSTSQSNPSMVNSLPQPLSTNPIFQSHSHQETDDEETYLPKQFAVLPRTSKRRMKKKPECPSNNTTIANVPSNMVLSLNSTLLKKMTVDMYYDITSAGHPFLPREDLENLSVNDDQRTNLAFMFSLQTLCYQRFGLSKQAHDSFQKAKNLVMFNPGDPNLFNTACTYVNLALYCNSSGDPENAKNFSRILDYNILRDDSFRDTQNPEQLKALIQMKKISDISGGGGYYGDERGLNDVSKFILSIYQYSTGGERPVPPEMMQIARQPLNMETLPEYLSLLDCVMKMMLIYESKGLHFSDTQKKMTKYLYYGLSYGMKILLLKLCGIKGSELEQAAEKITLLCRTPTFTFAPTFLIQPVGLALDVHCEMLKEIDQGERSNIEEFKTAKLLRNDIESLRFLSSRYPELCANFNLSIEQAESLLEKKGRSLSRFLEAEVYSSNSGGITIIEDELKFIEGQIKESVKLKRKSREESQENLPDTNTPSSSIAVPTSTDISNPFSTPLPSNPNLPTTNGEFSKNYGVDPLTYLSAEDYELLFGEEDQNSVHDNIEY